MANGNEKTAGLYQAGAARADESTQSGAGPRPSVSVAVTGGGAASDTPA